jgi:hypothetical protein
MHAIGGGRSTKGLQDSGLGSRLKVLLDPALLGGQQGPGPPSSLNKRSSWMSYAYSCVTCRSSILQGPHTMAHEAKGGEGGGEDVFKDVGQAVEEEDSGGYGQIACGCLCDLPCELPVELAGRGDARH